MVRRILVVAGAVVLVVAAVPSLVLQSDEHGTVYRVSNSYAEYSLEDLRDRAEAVVIFTVTGPSSTHWNNAADEPWALDQVGKLSHIYRDETITVNRVISGSAPEGTIIVRTLGGHVGDNAVEYMDSTPLGAGETYLGILRHENTPTREGSQLYWTFVWQGNGVFSATGDEWRNSAGVKAAEADFTQ